MSAYRGKADVTQQSRKYLLVIHIRHAPCAAADQAPGIGKTGITSTDSPGKIVKCGWFSNNFAAASFDSARMTVKAPMSLLVSSMPRCVIFLVLPRGPPMATTAPWCCSTQSFHAAIPSRSADHAANGAADHRTNRPCGLAANRSTVLDAIWNALCARRQGNREDGHHARNDHL